MSPLSARYICAACGTTYDTTTALWRCPACRSHVNLSDGPGLNPAAIDTADPTLWRYGAALRVARDDALCMGEGMTPLIARPWDGQSVHMKMDFMAPTGSFKDRGIAVLMAYLRAAGIATILEDSSGNAGAAMAAYAAAAGIACRILVPASRTSRQAGADARRRRRRGAHRRLPPGRHRRGAHRSRDDVLRQPPTGSPSSSRGTKTVAYEIWEQLGFRAPDNVVAPAGGGGNVLGAAIGFKELLAAGQIDRMPRIFAVQAAHCAPLVAAYEAGASDYVPTETQATIADGIALARPVRMREMLAALRQTGGAGVAVSEAEILAALKALLRLGLFVEPTSAAGAAGVSKLIAQGTIKAGETTALILTGSGLKAGAKIGELLGLDR